MTKAAPPSANDLYVGYLPTPRRHRRAMRLLVPTLLWGLCAIAALIAGNLAPAGDGVWDADTTTIEGTLIADPYPGVRRESDAGSFETTFLVEVGKRGPRPTLRLDAGRRIAATGFLLHRDGRRVLELLPDAQGVAPAPGTSPSAAPRAVDLGDATLRGEIVDYKCFMGAMKPAHGLTHRACATLCVSGGIPPALVTTDDTGRHTYYILRTPDRQPLNERVLALIAIPVEITGTVHQEADVLYLNTTPEQIRPL